MDGLLVIDKPSGPTSHDVVARVRRLLNERRVGHTGTLDPMATGLLPVVVGRATRLAQFLSAATKRYEAVVRLGIETDTYDATGAAAGAPYEGPWPSREAIEQALDAFRGTFDQQPPAFSAKKIDGQRSYQLARARAREADEHSSRVAGPHPRSLALGHSVPRAGRRRSLPDPVPVTARAIEVLGLDGALVRLRVDCSTGFYIRSLAHDLGERLGTGAHLFALRRTGSGSLTLDDAVELEKAEQDPREAAARMVPLRRLLSDIPAVVLTPLGVQHAVNGRELGPADMLNEPGATGAGSVFRLMDTEGELVGIGHPGKDAGLLHPSIVLV
jgi:tRNA pseudouridine55 synthase